MRVYNARAATATFTRQHGQALSRAALALPAHELVIVASGVRRWRLRLLLATQIAERHAPVLQRLRPLPRRLRRDGGGGGVHSPPSASAAPLRVTRRAALVNTKSRCKQMSKQEESIQKEKKKGKETKEMNDGPARASSCGAREERSTPRARRCASADAGRSSRGPSPASSRGGALPRATRRPP